MARHPLMLATLVAAAVTACGGDGGDGAATAPAISLAGTYPLRSYNGRAVPLVVARDAVEGTVEITAGRLVLSGDNTFSESLSYRITPPGVGAVADTGTLGSTGRYTTEAEATRIVFTLSSGAQVQARHDRGTITVAGDGATFVYSR